MARITMFSRLLLERKVLFAALALMVILLSYTLLIINGEVAIRPSADSDETVPLWERLVAPVVASVVIFLIPYKTQNLNKPSKAQFKRLSRESIALSILALGYVMAALIFGATEPQLTISKVTLLVILPLTLLLLYKKWYGKLTLKNGEVNFIWPLIPVAVWIGISYFSPLAPSPAIIPGIDIFTLVLILIGGFLINAVIEEVFYRRWLQTRLEATTGWIAGVLIAAILWAMWHVAIQSIGQGVVLDFSAVIASHIPLGIFLGLLWWRYRKMWPLLIVHGLVNSAPIALGLL